MSYILKYGFSLLLIFIGLLFLKTGSASRGGILGNAVFIEGNNVRIAGGVAVFLGIYSFYLQIKHDNKK